MAKTTTKNKTKVKAKTTKKAGTTKSTAGKAKSKTATAKKTGVKKTTAKKTTSKKTSAKKPAVKKTGTKKTTARSTAKKTSTAKVKATAKTKASGSKAKRTTTKSTSATKSGRKIEVVRSTPKPAKKLKGYSKKDLDEFKKVILDKRSEIIEQLQNLKEQMMDATTGQYVNENSPYSLHMAEQGTDAQEREKLYLWAQRETKFLGYLEDALQRIENGTYGICIDSLELKEGPHLIPKNRLLAVPHTQHCVDCKNKKK